MLSDNRIAVIIPALNEEKTLPSVLKDIPRNIVDEVIVVDNGSTDRTSSVAGEHGATVLYESKKGYGYPCLKAIEYLKTTNPDIVVFVDANYSDHPDEIIKLLRPMVDNHYELVLGSRIMGDCEKGALRLPVRFGNSFAIFLTRILYGFRFTDIGPFRAIRFHKLLDLNMQDNLGWTIEMQIKAIRKKFRIIEVPVSYRAGTGKSKLTGNVKGIIVIGYRILKAIFTNLFYK